MKLRELVEVLNKQEFHSRTITYIEVFDMNEYDRRYETSNDVVFIDELGSNYYLYKNSKDFTEDDKNFLDREIIGLEPYKWVSKDMKMKEIIVLKVGYRGL